MYLEMFEVYRRKYFFEYIIPKYHTIIADSQQTCDGRRFWMNRINDAFDRNLNVYFYHMMNKTIQLISDHAEFSKLISNNKTLWDANQKKPVIENGNF
jgi:hypothetical protein